MEYMVLTKDIIKKSKLLKSINHYESDIRILNDLIYKILFEENRTDMRKETIITMSNLNDSNCLSALYILTLDNKFCGCVLPYLKNYINLSNFLKHNQIDLQTRKDLCYSICDKLDFLENNNLLFNDIYLDNIMINPNNIDDIEYKLIDLDGCLLKNKIHIKAYNCIKKNITYNLAQVIFAILLNYNFNFDTVSNDTLYKIYKKSSNKQKEFLDKAIYREGKYTDLRDYIDLFNEEYLEEGKLKLSRKN